MAHGLIDVSNERTWAAVDRMLYLHANQGGAPLGLLAWAAVEETFCTGVTGVRDAFEHRLSVLHAGLVADVLQRAERRLGEPSQAGFIASHVPPFSGWKYGLCDSRACSALDPREGAEAII